MDGIYLHFWGNLFQRCEEEIQYILHFIIPTLQGIHGYQEEWLGGGQGFCSNTGEVHVPEELQ